ncbi:MAG TPA: dihydropteroate synthase [Planctomycetota bacterium]|nr:dihydropteroate synthase [Planctomycetota bacterium]
MTAKLPYNPRVIVAPGDAALAAEIQRLVGFGPPVGDWFLKLEGLRSAQCAPLVGQASRHGGGALVHEKGDGSADALLRVPGDVLEALLSALAADEAGDDLVGAIRATADAWQQRRFVLQCGPRTLEVGCRTLLMGIVNVTPDSFSDGGQFYDPGKAIEHGRRLAAEGADILDIGGESTRPGAGPVDAETECARVLPVIEALAGDIGIPISIDTSKAAVARRALAAGATVLNDVTALRGDAAMAAVAAEAGVPVVLMHMQGTPRSMQEAPHYDDLMSEVVAYLRGSMAIAVDAGVREDQLVVDPGLGFGKALAHNLEIVRRLGELRSLGRPILLGPSRKSMIGKVLGGTGILPVGERMPGTAAVVGLGIARGAHMVRVHDLAAMRQVARMTDAMLAGERAGFCEGRG